MDKQGCTNNYPGIGNIEYVKDLLAGKIVNKKFNCSRFGPSYPSNLGWVSEITAEIITEKLQMYQFLLLC